MSGNKLVIKYINNCIIENKFDENEFKDFVNSKVPLMEDRSFIFHLLENKKDLISINREIYNYFYSGEKFKKHEKSMEKFNQNTCQQILEQDYKQYENFVYSLVSIKDFKTKMSKTRSKVRLLYIDNLFGHDTDQYKQDLFQESKLYLWEGIKKYGYIPLKEKNIRNRLENGYKRIIASKSTFLHKNLKNKLINLSLKSNSDKFRHIPVEFDKSIYGEKEDDDGGSYGF